MATGKTEKRRVETPGLNDLAKRMADALGVAPLAPDGFLTPGQIARMLAVDERTLARRMDSAPDKWESGVFRCHTGRTCKHYRLRQ